MSGIYTLSELMTLLGRRDRDSFRAHRKRIEAMGFPKPLPGCTRPLQWSRAQVDAWLDNPRPAQKALRESAHVATSDDKPKSIRGAIDEVADAKTRIRERLSNMSAAPRA